MNCFISAEAVNWCHQWLPGIENLAQGLALMQVRKKLVQFEDFTKDKRINKNCKDLLLL